MQTEQNKQHIPSIWKNSVMNVIYTLTPTHCGTGQAASSVDLPIARDVVTGFPILPATSLKGVAREYFENNEKTENITRQLTHALFGPDIATQEHNADNSGALQAAGLAFTEGGLIAYPARSLNRPFLHVTCPLIIENLFRNIRLLFPEAPLSNLSVKSQDFEKSNIYTADEELAQKTVIIEDLCYSQEETFYNENVADLARALASLLPETEEDAAARLERGLVVLPDIDFTDLIQRAIPVAARIQLTGGKTTDTWLNPETDEQESGNLWYEEYLPSDCLFISFTGHRKQVYMQRNTNDEDENSNVSYEKLESPLQNFTEIWKKVPCIQIGGNETIGNGICLWETCNAFGTAADSSAQGGKQ